MRARVKLYGTENTIIRPVIVRVVQDIIANLGGGKNIYVYLDENSNIVKGHMKNRRRFVSTRKEALSKVTGNLKEFARLTNFEDALDDNSGNDLNFLRPDSIPIVIDKEIKLSIVPIKQRRKITISVEYSNQDRAELIAMANSMPIEQVFPGITYYHDLEYNYILPKVITSLLANIVSCMNKTLEQIGRDKVDFVKYIDKIADDRMTFTSPDTGEPNDAVLTILERQASVVGYFTGNISDLKPETNEDGGYSINVDYTFTYDEVVAFDVHYPALIYNNRIDKSFIVKNKVVMKSRVGVYDPMQGALVKANEDMGVLASPYLKLDYLTVPYWDDMLPKAYPSYYQRILTSLIILNNDDRRSLRNIKTIETISFKPQVLDLILGNEREYVTKIKRSFVYFALYEDDKLRTDIELYLDSDGVLSSTIDLDLTKTYRVGIFLLVDYNYLKEEDYNRLKYELTTDLSNMTEKCVLAIKNYEHLNSELIKHNKNEYLLGITNIKNQYVPCLDVLADVYNLTQQDKDNISKAYPDCAGMFFRMISRAPNVPLSRNVQYYTAQLNKLVDYKPKTKE